MIQTSKLPLYLCIVPMCQNTSIKTPEKTFIRVPINEKRRRLWLRAVRRDPKEFSKTSCIFVCEDHFDLENDMENYLRWKMMGGLRLMKRDAVPHIFECQMERELIFPENSKIATVENIEVHEPRVSEMEPKKKNIGVTARPYYRSKQTQTEHKIISKSCSASIGTLPLVKKKLPVYKGCKKKIVFSSPNNIRESATSTTSLYVRPNIDSG